VDCRVDPSRRSMGTCEVPWAGAVILWIYVDQRRARPWCALVRATPGGRIVTLCSEFGYDVLPISTDEPHAQCCAACLSRIGTMPTAMTAVADDDLAIPSEAGEERR
jgi:hypothetical protein